MKYDAFYHRHYIPRAGVLTPRAIELEDELFRLTQDSDSDDDIYLLGLMDVVHNSGLRVMTTWKQLSLREQEHTVALFKTYKVKRRLKA